MLSIHWYYSFYLPFPPFTPHTPSHLSSQHPSNTKNIIIKSHQWAISSVVECLLSVEDAAGSIPALSNVYIFYWYYWMYVMCVCGWDDVWMWWDVCEGWECEDVRWSGVGWWWEKCEIMIMKGFIFTSLLIISMVKEGHNFRDFIDHLVNFLNVC